MSPLFVPVVLAVMLGMLFFLLGLIFRKKKLIVLGCPAVLLCAGWLVMASIPPDGQREFDRLFGEYNRVAVTELHVFKPTFMGGHFLDFWISPDGFKARILPQCEEVSFTNFHLLRDQKLPDGWPQSVVNAESALSKRVDHDKILVFYDASLKRAFVSVLYDHW